jgi:hypothetical protein
MTLQTSNKRILSFFEQRPEMDFESTILKFIDIMESLNENMNKTLTNTTVMEILDNIKSMRSDNQANLSKYMTEIKRGLNEDIRMIMSNSMNEKLEPTLRVKLKEQQTQLVDNVSVRIEKLFESKISGIKEINSANKDILSEQNNTLNDLLKRFENSSKKGKLSENLLFNTLYDIYPCAEITDVGKTKETGDIMLGRKNKQTILVENKDWTRPIVNAEVVKFVRDVETQKCNGLFLSQNVGICSKDNFEVNILENNLVVVYIHNVNYDPDKIRTGVEIIDNISDILREIDVLEYNESEQYTISKEITQHINAEYQNYLSHKEKTIKMARDFVANLIKHEEEFNFISLEKYLSTKYSPTNSKNTCKYCGYVGKKANSLSAHLRGCQKYKDFMKKSKDGEEQVCITIS